MAREQPFLSRYVFFATLLLILAALSLLTLNYLGASVWRQFAYWLLGFSFLALFLYFRPSLSNWRHFDYFIYLAIIILLTLPLFLAPPIHGARRWLLVEGLSLQVSEIIKPFFIFALTSLTERWPNPQKKWIWLPLILALPVVFLLLREPDLGSAGLFLSLAIILMFLNNRRPLKFGFWLLILGAVAFMVAGQFLSPYQGQRLNVFLHPGRDPLGAGYNTLQAKIAIGSGQLFGQGFANLSQRLKFLPERTTDFAFASWANATGLGGVVLLLATYAMLLLFLANYISHTRQHWLFKIKILLLFQLWVQLTINLGMNLGLLPVTGLPLPFFSYGGSSLLATFLALAFILS